MTSKWNKVRKRKPHFLKVMNCHQIPFKRCKNEMISCFSHYLQKIVFQRKKKCTPTTRLLRREKITYKNCKSVRAYRLKFCTNCRENKCCYPKRTKTREIEFLCNDGRYEYYKYAWIKRCKCSKRCKTDTINL